MEKEVNISQKAVLFSLYVMMVFTLANTMGSALALNISFSVRLLLSTGISTFMLIILLYPVMWMIFAGLVMAGTLTINRFFPAYRFIIYEGFSGFLINLIQHFQGKEVILPENVLAFWIIMVGALSLLTAIYVFRKLSTWPVLLVYGMAFVIYWYSHIDLSYSMLMVFLVLYLILYSRKKYQLSQKVWRDEKADVQQDMYAPWQKTAVVYGLIIVLGAAVLPKGDFLLEWRWLEARLMNRFPVLMDLRGSVEHSRGFGTSEYFSFSTTGFQDDPQVLGGPVQLSDRLVMTVEATQPFYLRGNVKSFYQYNAWGHHQANTKSQSIHQPLSPDALGVINGEEMTLSITYNNFSSATIFSPYQPLQVENQRYEQVTVNDNYQLTFEGGVFRNESYILDVVIPIPGQINGLEPVGFLPADYLQLPDTIDQSIAQLTTSITQGISDDYVKALALQDYLRDHHAYSLEVSHVPPGNEFVEHFLFDTKEGYCTYFATALAVMLRLEGIPSRYVEGYLMPQHSHDGVFEVRQKNAHAWVEAYFQGLGWITLEPTPAYPAQDHGPSTGTAAGMQGNLSGEFNEFLMLLESMERNNESLNEREEIILETSTTGNESDENAGQTFMTIQRFNRLFIGLIISLMWVLLIRIAWVQRRFRRYQQQLKGLTTRGQVIHLYGNILELLTTFGYPLEGGETPFEFSKRISKHLYDIDHRFEKLSATYVLAQYSQADIPDDSLLQMAAYLQYMDQRNRHKMGIIPYVYLKYLRYDYYSIHINPGSGSISK